MFIADRFTNISVLKNYKTVTKNLKEILLSVIQEMIIDKPMFTMKDFDIYFFDDYCTNTNTNMVGEITAYIELSQPNNIRPHKDNFFAKIDKSPIKAPELNFTLEKFKSNLLDIIVHYFDAHASFWKTEYGIKFSTTEEIDEDTTQSYIINVIPCLSYVNESHTQGVMFYGNDKRNIEIRYPKLSKKNFDKKDKDTNKMFSYYVVLFKNLFMYDSKTESIPSEVFETILYNVPNELLKSNDLTQIFIVINYIRNSSLKDMKTIDEQDQAYISKYRSFSYFFVKHAIKQVGNAIKSLK